MNEEENHIWATCECSVNVSAFHGVWTLPCSLNFGFLPAPPPVLFAFLWTTFLCMTALESQFVSFVAKQYGYDWLSRERCSSHCSSVSGKKTAWPWANVHWSDLICGIRELHVWQHSFQVPWQASCMTFTPGHVRGSSVSDRSTLTFSYFDMFWLPTFCLPSVLHRRVNFKY